MKRTTNPVWLWHPRGECYKSWSGLPLTRPGPRPAQYLEDGGTAEAQREERERADFRREKDGHKAWRKGNPFLFLVDVIFPLLCISSFPNPNEFRFQILSIYLHLGTPLSLIITQKYSVFKLSNYNNQMFPFHFYFSRFLQRTYAIAERIENMNKRLCYAFIPTWKFSKMLYIGEIHLS